jgi:hypothetical protein
LKTLDALADLSAHISRLIHAVVDSFPQARGILSCSQDINIVGELSIAAEEGLKLALEIVLKFLESRVVTVAAAAAPGFEIVRHDCG